MVRTDAKDISAVHVLVERELGGHLLRGGDDALVEGVGKPGRLTWTAPLNPWTDGVN